MNKAEKYYTEEEKQLFLDHFLYKGDEVKGKFRQYLEDYIKTNGIEVEDNLKKPQVYRGPEEPNQLQRNNWTYDSHNMLWDKHTRDNVLTHTLPLLLDEPDIKLDHGKIRKILTSLKNMNKLHPNWNHKNKEGNTPLHIVCQKGHYFIAARLIKEFDLNTDLKNKNGDYYTFLLVHPDTKSMLHPSWIAEEFNKNSHHFEKASMDKLLELKTNIEKLKEIELTVPKNGFSKSSYSFEQLQKIVEDKYKPLDDFINQYYLKKVENHNDNLQTTKMKM